MKEVFTVLIWVSLDELIKDIIKDPLIYIIFILSIIVYPCIAVLIEVCCDSDYHTEYYDKS